MDTEGADGESDEFEIEGGGEVEATENVEEEEDDVCMDDDQADLQDSGVDKEAITNASHGHMARVSTYAGRRVILTDNEDSPEGSPALRENTRLIQQNEAIERGRIGASSNVRQENDNGIPGEVSLVTIFLFCLY